MVHEIKSAIILAAGRGKRLNELTNDKPKPLCKVRGQVLIERLIEQLQSKGINNIYVVTGYKHKMFDYLHEKYGVNLVYNKKWFCTNNIVSFVKGYEVYNRFSSVHGLILLDADLYIEDNNVIQTSIEHSGYYLEYCDDANRCAKEWVADISDTDEITHVVTDGSHKQGYVLRSLSFWTFADMAMLYIYAKEAMMNGKNKQRYIDDISCVLYSDAFDLYGYISNKSALLEIDTMIDYNNANKETNNEKNS